MIIKLDLALADWRTSTYSNTQGGCVSVANLGAYCAVRDSKNVEQRFTVSRDSWNAFIEALKRREIQ
ncbi:DUF397 domain-containing protein [Nonomuraea typhae]|uniref:DUF397 domain-containing protein n=1 Tax=Nonomuraea typhae TaxID=2603600 RepID=UPI0012F7BA6D|nr:DUF397 domain-containing protein [Nonomuraea typhae]